MLLRFVGVVAYRPEVAALSLTGLIMAQKVDKSLTEEDEPGFSHSPSPIPKMRPLCNEGKDCKFCSMFVKFVGQDLGCCETENVAFTIFYINQKGELWQLSTLKKYGQIPEAIGVYFGAARGKIGPWLRYLYHCVETGKVMETKLIEFCKTTDFFRGRIMCDNLLPGSEPKILFMHFLTIVSYTHYPVSLILNCEIPKKPDTLRSYYRQLMIEKMLLFKEEEEMRDLYQSSLLMNS